MRSYISFVKTFKGWLAKNGIKESAYCVCVSREIALQFMNEIDENIKMSAKTYNNYLSFFRSLFNWMRDKGYVHENPFTDIPKKAKRLTKKSRNSWQCACSATAASCVRKKSCCYGAPTST